MTATKDGTASDTNRLQAAMRRAEKTVTLRPERGQRVYRNVARLEHGTRCSVEEGARTLTVDMGKALGGEDAGPNPSMVLRSAISSCLAIGIKQWAARSGVTLERVEVVLETVVDARGQLGVADEITPGFEDFAVAIDVTTSANRRRVEEIVATALRYSPLMDVLERPQRITRSLKGSFGGTA